MLTEQQVAEIIKAPFENSAYSCHAVSLAIVRSRIIPGARVARGTCRGVTAQHSWIVTGNPYNPDHLFDPTLWSYDDSVKGVWQRSRTPTSPDLLSARHTPHGYGRIWHYGKPHSTTRNYIELTPSIPLSQAAQNFLDLIEPLDRNGWAQLANSPVLGWPSEEIIAAMDDTPILKALVPIDILGMLTDRNPGELYLP